MKRWGRSRRSDYISKLGKRHSGTAFSKLKKTLDGATDGKVLAVLKLNGDSVESIGGKNPRTFFIGDEAVRRPYAKYGKRDELDFAKMDNHWFFFYLVACAVIVWGPPPFLLHKHIQNTK